MTAADTSRAFVYDGQLGLSSTRQGDEHVMKLFGELNRHNAGPLREELRRAESTDAARTIVDLTRLSFVDASGVRLLLQAQARARRKGDRLLFLRAPERVDRVFRVTGAERLLAFID